MPRFYRTIAVIVLNTLLLFAGLELTARVVLYLVAVPASRAWLSRVFGRHDLVAHYLALPYYAEQNWAAQYWQEHLLALKKRYYPYVIWRSPSFSGTTLNIDQNGVRRTPAANCLPGSYKVFAFGGSAMWGWGAPDWGTIPAYLQAKLQVRHSEPVCVVNFGEQAYVATQNLIQLLLQLEVGNIPDLVIFYDGVNEVLAASQSGRPVVHQNFAEIETRFQDSQSPLLASLQNLKVIRVLQMVVAAFTPRRSSSAPSNIDVDQLADTVVQAYLSDHKIVSSSAETYKFDYYFFWQPYILIGSKPLTVEEQRMITGLDWVLKLDPNLSRLFEITYRHVAVAAQHHVHLHYSADIFDTVTSQVWLDTWGHVTPVGNELIAQAIIDVITSNQSSHGD